MLNCTCVTKHVSTFSINGITLYIHIAVKEPIRSSKGTSLVFEFISLQLRSKIFPPAFSRFEENSRVPDEFTTWTVRFSRPREHAWRLAEARNRDA